MAVSFVRQLLRSFLRAATGEVQMRFDRVLPFGDYVSDRWEKARILEMGEGSSVYDSAVILGRPKVGKGVWIGPHTVIDATGGLEIGDYCNISAGVQIYSHDSIERCLSGGFAAIERSPVIIGAKTYIGPNSVITKGVQIGDGCLIGANSLVLQDVPDGWMAVGSPCRLVRPVKSIGCEAEDVKG